MTAAAPSPQSNLTSTSTAVRPSGHGSSPERSDVTRSHGLKLAKELQHDCVDLVRFLLGRGMANSGHGEDVPNVGEVDFQRFERGPLSIDAIQRFQRRIVFAGQKEGGLLDGCAIKKRRDFPPAVYR